MGLERNRCGNGRERGRRTVEGKTGRWEWKGIGVGRGERGETGEERTKWEGEEVTRGKEGLKKEGRWEQKGIGEGGEGISNERVEETDRRKKDRRNVKGREREGKRGEGR